MFELLHSAALSIANLGTYADAEDSWLPLFSAGETLRYSLWQPTRRLPSLLAPSQQFFVRFAVDLASQWVILSFNMASIMNVPINSQVSSIIPLIQREVSYCCHRGTSQMWYVHIHPPILPEEQKRQFVTAKTKITSPIICVAPNEQSFASVKS